MREFLPGCDLRLRRFTGRKSSNTKEADEKKIPSGAVLSKSFCRLLCVLLALLILWPAFGAVPASALTKEESVCDGFDVFNAWYILNGFDYEPVITYKGDACAALLQQIDTPLWKGMLAAWQTANFKLSDLTDGMTNEVGYYQGTLLNILYRSEYGDEEVMPPILSSVGTGLSAANASLKSLSANATEKVSELGGDTLTDMKKILDPDIDDPKLLQSVYSNCSRLEELSDAIKVIDKAGDYIDYCKSAYDLTEKICQVQLLIDGQQATASILRDIRVNGGSQGLNETAWKYALSQFESALSGEIDPGILYAVFTGEEAFGKIAKACTKTIWKMLLGKLAFPIGLGQTVGRFTADALFDTSDTVTAYYELLVAKQLQDEFRGAFWRSKQAFEANPTPDNANRLCTAFQLVLSAYIEGTEKTVAYLDHVWEGGAVSQLNGSGHQRYEIERKLIMDIQKALKQVATTVPESSYALYLYELTTMPWLAGGAMGPAQDWAKVFKDDILVESSMRLSHNMTLDNGLIIQGDLTLTDGTLDMNGCEMIVLGDLILKGGTLKISGNLLTVFGDVRHSGGTLDVGSGSLAVGGNYWLLGAASRPLEGTERCEYGNGCFVMTTEGGHVDIGGSFIAKTHGEINLMRGHMYVRGDFLILGDTVFLPNAKNIITFTGEYQQVVRFEDKKQRFGSVEFHCPKVILEGDVDWRQLIGILPRIVIRKPLEEGGGDVRALLLDELENELKPMYGEMGTAPVYGDGNAWNADLLEGILSAAITDFDSDGQEELLVFRFEQLPANNIEGASSDEVSLSMTMYESISGIQVVCQAEKDLVISGLTESQGLYASSAGGFVFNRGDSLGIAIDTFFGSNEYTTTLSTWRYDGMDFVYTGAAGFQQYGQGDILIRAAEKEDDWRLQTSCADWRTFMMDMDGSTTWRTLERFDVEEHDWAEPTVDEREALFARYQALIEALGITIGRDARVMPDTPDDVNGPSFEDVYNRRFLQSLDEIYGQTDGFQQIWRITSWMPLDDALTLERENLCGNVVLGE